MRFLIIAAVLVTLLMLVPVGSLGVLPLAPALRGELQNFAHPLIFAVLALLGRRTMQQSFGTLRGRHLLLLAGALVVFAVFTEVLQGFTGREQSLGDFIGDLLGICAGILWPLRRRIATWAATLAAVLACIPLSWTVSAYLYRQAQLPLVWHVDSTLLNRFSHWQAGAYPGLVLDEVPADWRGYQALALTIRNPGAEVASFTVRIHDAAHDQRYDDRFNRSFHLAPGTTGVFRIPLDDIATAPAGRPLDLTAVAGIILFQDATDAGARIAPIQIRLDQTYPR